MASLKGSKTHDNLKDAFAGESQANRRYLYFAKQADIEGYPDVGGLFRDTAEAETGHAHGHLDYLKQAGDPATGKPIGGTDKNLAAAVAGETYEYTEMYPGMAKTARTENFAEIAEWFETLAKAEKSHAGRFQRRSTASRSSNRARPGVARAGVKVAPPERPSAELRFGDPDYLDAGEARARAAPGRRHLPPVPPLPAAVPDVPEAVRADRRVRDRGRGRRDARASMRRTSSVTTASSATTTAPTRRRTSGTSTSRR